MSKDYSTVPINELRRKDRSADDSFIKTFLHESPFCSIANINDNQPFIHSNIFVYDEQNHAIYFHTAKEGRFRFNIENNSKVCFSTAEMGRLLPAEVALEFSVEYKSVVVFGKVSIIENDSDAQYALQNLLDKYFPHLKPGADYRGIVPEELKRTTVYKLSIEKWSGKIKKAADNFPGAFFYNQV